MKDRREYWWLPIISAAYGAIMVMLGGTAWGWSPYHRLQAEALLHGHLALGSAIEQMQPGLAWHDGHVQQVWGLGIGLWLSPFQAVWRSFSSAFPDRIALGVAFGLFAFYGGNTGWQIAQNGRRVTGLGLTWLILLSPPLWTLARASQLVFEETVLYALIVSLCLLVGIIRVAAFASRRDYALVCVLASVSGFVRPTQAIYGLCAVLVCSTIIYVRRKTVKTVAFGLIGFAAALTLLAWTNQIRFGSPVEFGHRQTASSDSMVYLTRFGNPYAATPFLDAALELNGMLFFDSHIRDAYAFADSQFPGQASSVRWRRLYLTLFDPAHDLLLGLTVLGAVGWVVWKRTSIGSWFQPERGILVWLWIWSFATFSVLACFYLRFPIMASRYLLDFLPAITGFVIVAWLVVSLRWPKVSLGLLAVWLMHGIAAGRIPMLASPSHIGTDLPRATGVPLKQFEGKYTLSGFPAETGISHNGYGWESENGFAGDIVILAADRPEFVELTITERRGVSGEPARPDFYRATMDGKPLPLQKVAKDGERLKVVFDVPPELKTDNQFVFLCFSQGYDPEDRNSERFLYSVRWR